MGLRKDPSHPHSLLPRQTKQLSHVFHQGIHVVHFIDLNFKPGRGRKQKVMQTKGDAKKNKKNISKNMIQSQSSSTISTLGHKGTKKVTTKGHKKRTTTHTCCRAMYALNFVNDRFPLPPTPTNNALPRGQPMMREMRIKCSNASSKNTKFIR